LVEVEAAGGTPFPPHISPPGLKTAVNGPVESLFHGNQDSVSVVNNDVQFSLGAFG
jgi:hypothetical protein